MGWDNLKVEDYIDEPTIDENDVGKQEYEVEVDVHFTVKYKVLAKDKTELIDKTIYVGGADLSIKDDNLENIYDLRVKNWGTDNHKENVSHKTVIAKKIDEDEPSSKDNTEYELE